jgi:transcriptional regulator with XRE-family HTH domain
VGNYKNGKSFPDVAVLIKIANYFQVDVNDLLFSKLLDKSNNSINQENDIKNPKILDKSNKSENGDDNKNDNRHDNNGYILEENQGLDREEEKEAQYHDKALKPSKSEYFEFLKKEIAFKNKIIETLLQITMIKEEDIEAKVRKALRKNEDKPLITIVSKVEKEVLKTAKTKEEEQLIADIFVRILTRLSEED